LQTILQPHPAIVSKSSYQVH